MKATFPKAKVSSEIIKNVRDFVSGCIRLNPKDRPTIDEVLEHKIFGGPKLFPRKKNDIWKEKGES